MNKTRFARVSVQLYFAGASSVMMRGVDESAGEHVNGYFRSAHWHRGVTCRKDNRCVNFYLITCKLNTSFRRVRGSILLYRGWCGTTRFRTLSYPLLFISSSLFLYINYPHRKTGRERKNRLTTVNKTCNQENALSIDPNTVLMVHITFKTYSQF